MHKTKRKVSCLVITVSDTRTIATDKSGSLIKEMLLHEGHEVFNHMIVRDEETAIAHAIEKGIENDDVNAVLLTGGTGISKRDVTIEVVKGKIEKELNGFGEIFRMLSYTEDIGSKAIMSRAIAGVVDRTVIFAMPGSQGAVKLAMNKLILRELNHVVYELYKDIE